MIISVVSDLVPVIHDATDKLRITFRICPHEEKRSLHVCSFEDVQDLRGPSRIGAIIKTDCNLMLAAGPLMVEGRKLREFYVLRREIALRVDSKLAHSIRSEEHTSELQSLTN